MKITSLKLIINEKEDSNLKATGRIVLDDCLAIHNLKVIAGKNRLFVAFPDRKLKEKYVNTVHPINNEFREYIENEVLKEYHDHISK